MTHKCSVVFIDVMAFRSWTLNWCNMKELEVLVPVIVLVLKGMFTKAERITRESDKVNSGEERNVV
ncbi:uncharacterized protein G2W53_006116 [Senna tora]|uniref:Uncharacterized protein n=1 Tax=Senna tora TaxID=362788 RepID=A0A834X4C1_9FABA|nr:uncharacterized protein G2W53_006116 [Senna tora]